MCLFGAVGECNNGMECLGLSLKHVCLHHGCRQCEAAVHKVNACVACNDSLPVLSWITLCLSFHSYFHPFVLLDGTLHVP